MYVMESLVLNLQSKNQITAYVKDNHMVHFYVNVMLSFN